MITEIAARWLLLTISLGLTGCAEMTALQNADVGREELGVAPVNATVEYEFTWPEQPEHLQFSSEFDSEYSWGTPGDRSGTYASGDPTRIRNCVMGTFEKAVRSAGANTFKPAAAQETATRRYRLQVRLQTIHLSVDTVRMRDANHLAYCNLTYEARLLDETGKALQVRNGTAENMRGAFLVTYVGEACLGAACKKAAIDLMKAIHAACQ